MDAYHEERTSIMEFVSPDVGGIVTPAGPCTLKATVLDQDPVKQRLAEDDRIVMFTADNTSRTAYGWELMREIGQTGIPLLAIWSPDDPFTEPWQSTAYTSQQVMEALDEAEGELDAP